MGPWCYGAVSFSRKFASSSRMPRPRLLFDGVRCPSGLCCAAARSCACFTIREDRNVRQYLLCAAHQRLKSICAVQVLYLHFGLRLHGGRRCTQWFRVGTLVLPRR